MHIRLLKFNKYAKKAITVISKWVVVLLKRAVFILAWGYAGYCFWIDEQFKFSSIVFGQNNMQFIVILTSVCFLTFLNWLFESLKWQKAIADVQQQISLKTSFIGVLESALCKINVKCAQNKPA